MRTVSQLGAQQCQLLGVSYVARSEEARIWVHEVSPAVAPSVWMRSASSLRPAAWAEKGWVACRLQ